MPRIWFGNAGEEKRLRIAVFSDIHGNRHALEAVLKDIDAQEPDRIYCLGDLVGYGAFPNDVIEAIRSRGIPTIMGNYDDGMGFDKDECGCAYTTPESRRLGRRVAAMDSGAGDAGE